MGQKLTKDKVDVCTLVCDNCNREEKIFGKDHEVQGFDGWWRVRFEEGTIIFCNYLRRAGMLCCPGCHRKARQIYATLQGLEK